MKLRFSFTFKIMLPYLVLAGLFLALFLSEFDQGHSLVFWLSAGGMILSIVLGVLQNIWLKRPLNRVRNLIVKLTRGNIPEFTASRSADEIGELEKDLEKHVSHLRGIADFSRSLSSGDFSSNYEKLSTEDDLGEALLSLKGSLKDSQRESEIRRREEENRTWAAQGLAKFSSLFREAEDNLADLSGLLMQELVGYTEADVGALFIAMEQEETEEIQLELFGSFAFDREKYIERSFAFGEGLVGRAAVEKEVIYISELPADYIKIRSGLGEDVPSSVLLVPVMLDNQVMGVIELASLGEIPQHQIEFVHQLSDALATTLAKVKANLQTRKLLEQSKQQADELEKAQQVYAIREEKLLNEIESLRKEAP